MTLLAQAGCTTPQIAAVTGLRDRGGFRGLLVIVPLPSLNCARSIVCPFFQPPIPVGLGMATCSYLLQPIQVQHKATNWSLQVPSRDLLRRITKYRKMALGNLVHLAQKARNESVRLQATIAILDRGYGP